MIADAHNDLLLELVLRRDEPNPFARHWCRSFVPAGSGSRSSRERRSTMLLLSSAACPLTQTKET